MAPKHGMPVLVLTGEKAKGNFLIEQARLVASDAKGQVVPGLEHWLTKKRPVQRFLRSSISSNDHRRQGAAIMNRPNGKS
jgi:hypothetical protein